MANDIFFYVCVLDFVVEQVLRYLRLKEVFYRELDDNKI